LSCTKAGCRPAAAKVRAFQVSEKAAHIADSLGNDDLSVVTAMVTGGAGFIGSALVSALVADGEAVVTVDKLTYAGNLDNLASVADHPNHVFVRADIGDRRAMAAVFRDHRPRIVYHLAAESHVDRSMRCSHVQRDWPKPF
jgi:FlaA1/EpsC-like NDP-sugar epimerase